MVSRSSVPLQLWCACFSSGCSNGETRLLKGSYFAKFMARIKEKTQWQWLIELFHCELETNFFLSSVPVQVLRAGK